MWGLSRALKAAASRSLGGPAALVWRFKRQGALPVRPDASFALPEAQPLSSGRKCAKCRPRRRLAMPHVQPNRWLQVKPDEPWTRRCMKEKIADDGKRHR